LPNNSKCYITLLSYLSIIDYSYAYG